MLKKLKNGLIIILAIIMAAGLFGAATFAEDAVPGADEAVLSQEVTDDKGVFETDAGDFVSDDVVSTTGTDDLADENAGGATDDAVTGNMDDAAEDETVITEETTAFADEVSDTEEKDEAESSEEISTGAGIKKAPSSEEAKTGEETTSAEETTVEETTTEEETTKKEIAIKSIKLDVTKKEIATKETFKLNATVTPKDATEEVVWTSSDENIATVDKNGKVKILRYGKVTITASNESNNKQATCAIQTRFYDVNKTSEYYYKPVYWAADKGITLGYDNVYFGPQRTCTRREMVIFLWRYSGKPASSAGVSFKDVRCAKDTDSYKAIQWAVGKGIIKGYDNKTFKPDNAVSRKDVMIMLYRMAGKPKASGEVKFRDVTTKKYSRGSDTYKSILWGTTVGITNGYSNGQFKPGANCLREHVVTFLYRYKDKKSKLAYIATPGSLNVSAGKGNLKFSWKAVKNARSYDVYRYVYKNKRFQKVATTKSTSWTYKDVRTGDKHSFKVVARSGSLSSDISKAVSGIYVATPSLKSAKAATTGIRVQWNKVSGATGYRIYRRTGNGSWKGVGNTTELQFVDTTVKNNTKYYFTVKAYKEVSGKKHFSYYDTKGKSASIKNKRGLTFTKGGTTYKYMEAYMGTTRQKVVEKLSKHEKDNYYNNTPCIGGDHRNVSGDPYHTYSKNDVYGRPGVNCTGFVWRLLYDSGCDYHYIPSMVGSNYCWQNPTDPGRNTWYGFSRGDAGFMPVYYRYRTVKELLADGKAKKGDIVYMLQTGEPSPSGMVDSHVGIFWGDSPSDNKLWHAGPTTEYGSQFRTGVTEINAGSPSTYYLFTWAN